MNILFNALLHGGFGVLISKHLTKRWLLSKITLVVFALILFIYLECAMYFGNITCEDVDFLFFMTGVIGFTIGYNMSDAYDEIKK